MTQQVIDTLKTWIRERALPPDEWIRQEEMARRLGVSRVPIREALSALAAEGLVEIVPHRGVRVTSLTWDRFVQATVLRSMSESMCCRFVVERATSEGIAALEKALEALRLVEGYGEVSGSDEGEAFRINWDFHMQLFRLSEFPQLYAFIEHLWQSTASYRRIFLADERVVSSDLQIEHERMAITVKERDAEGLIALHTAHRMRMFNYLRTHVFADEAIAGAVDWMLPALSTEVRWGDWKAG